MCDSPKLGEGQIHYYLHSHRLSALTRLMVKLYFRHARIIRVDYLGNSADAAGYYVQPCECRMDQVKCNNRLDTCFVKTRKSVDSNEKIRSLKGENLVRTIVNTGNFKHEICHCCGCCCFPITVQRVLGERVLLISGYYPAFDSGACRQCHKCHEICPFDAIDHDNHFNRDKCFGCGLCEKNCAAGAIRLRREREIENRRPFTIFAFAFLLVFHAYIQLLYKMRDLKSTSRQS